MDYVSILTLPLDRHCRVLHITEEHPTVAEDYIWLLRVSLTGAE